MFHFNQCFPFPSFFFLDRCSLFLESYFLGRERVLFLIFMPIISFYFFLVAFQVEGVFCLFFTFLFFFYIFPPPGLIYESGPNFGPTIYIQDRQLAAILQPRTFFWMLGILGTNLIGLPKLIQDFFSQSTVTHTSSKFTCKRLLLSR